MGNLHHLPQIDGFVAVTAEDDGSFRVYVVGRSDLEHINLTLPDGREALAKAVQIASANRLSVLFTPIPANWP